MRLDLDYTSPSIQYTYDLNKNHAFVKDNQNVINQLSVNEMNSLDNLSLLDIFLSVSNVVEPHYHQNSSELVYCIAGSAVVSILNPYTKQLLNFPITPGQVANVPQGWWHYEIATVDNTHLLAIFNAPSPDVILFSDLLKFTPTNIVSHTYCLDENQWKTATASLQPSVFIGPPKNCNQQVQQSRQESVDQYNQKYYHQHYYQQRY
ncbi:cupin domain-containing protein [Bacillus sp. AFS017336]|uniref:cupin domain-containing protein n=1 Tax=Bacillus sp. AFS017336 TaxID=2033489 RepID=UPI000BF0BC0F|nr:cupin domain-containing protein [Bacillus sp. AFS017336]PEK98130.1 cupin [Bacillus sp. AFS017336]